MRNATGTLKMGGVTCTSGQGGLPWTGREFHLHRPTSVSQPERKDDEKTHGEDRFDAASRNRPFGRGSRVVLAERA